MWTGRLSQRGEPSHPVEGWAVPGAVGRGKGCLRAHPAPCPARPSVEDKNISSRHKSLWGIDASVNMSLNKDWRNTSAPAGSSCLNRLLGLVSWMRCQTDVELFHIKTVLGSLACQLHDMRVTASIATFPRVFECICVTGARSEVCSPLVPKHSPEMTFITALKSFHRLWQTNSCCEKRKQSLVGQARGVPASWNKGKKFADLKPCFSISPRRTLAVFGGTISGSTRF